MTCEQVAQAQGPRRNVRPLLTWSLSRARSQRTAVGRAVWGVPLCTASGGAPASSPGRALVVRG